jgi:hypothetical protein
VIEWNRLSPESCEVAIQFGFRLTASDLTRTRPAMKYLRLSEGYVTKSSVAARLRDLRQALAETGAAKF